MTFPTNVEELAMLFLQNQDLSGLTPEQLADKYWDVYYRIKNRFEYNKTEKVNEKIM